MEDFELVQPHEKEKLKLLVKACATGERIVFEHSYLGSVRAIIQKIEFRHDRTARVDYREA